MNKIIAGVRHFQEHVFNEQRDFFQRLANRQQNPVALWITCSDSRVNPNLLTQTEPGDLFILRNAGNIIPPYGAANGGEAATIEYAVAVLGVPNIIICGHSQCGAMNALMNYEDFTDLSAVIHWCSHAEATRRIMKAKYPHISDAKVRLERTIEENLLVQLDNLRTHPAVAVALAKGALNLFAWVYLIESGQVLNYAADLGRFVPLTGEAVEPLPHLARLQNGDQPMPTRAPESTTSS